MRFVVIGINVEERDVRALTEDVVCAAALAQLWRHHAEDLLERRLTFTGYVDAKIPAPVVTEIASRLDFAVEVMEAGCSATSYVAAELFAGEREDELPIFVLPRGATARVLSEIGFFTKKAYPFGAGVFDTIVLQERGSVSGE